MKRETPSDIKALAASLRHRDRTTVMKAAARVAELVLRDRVPDLVAAVRRFMMNGEKVDKGCLAKVAILEALISLGCEDAALFIEGARYAQMEPVYGGRADMAGGVRGRCVVGLAEMGARDAVYEASLLLMDREKDARQYAVTALGICASEGSEVALRMRALFGDEPEVLEASFTALLRMAPDRSVPFVGRFLRHEDVIVIETAAVALGESRTPEAYRLLRALWDERLDQGLRKSLLLPLALTRLDEALAFLLEVADTAGSAMAAEAIGVLGMVYGADETVRRKVEAVVAERGEEAVQRAFAKAFI